jgi:hypothetical protein
LDWRTTLSVEESVTQTIRWYQAFFRGEDMTKFSVQQLGEYETMVTRPPE